MKADLSVRESESNEWGIGLCRTDGTGHILWTNDPAAGLLGATASSLTGRMLPEAAAGHLVLHAGARFTRAELKAMVREHRSILLAAPVALQDGQTLWLLLPMQELCDLAHEGMAFFDLARDGAIIADAGGVILDMNRACQDYGLEQWEIGRSVAEIMDSGTFSGSAIQRVVESGQPAISVVHRGERANISSAYPVLGPNGHVWRIVATVRDMTEIRTLRQQLEAAQGLTRTYEQQLRSKQNLSNLIAVSQNIRHVFDMAARLAGVDVTVFVEGESGVGKEVVAKFIHESSKRREGHFVRINCGAIPSQLLESELFGYEAGAFTGAANKGKPGLMELADGGTLFLDEVAELPLDVQVKLLHALQDQEVTRVGGLKSRKFNARIIAATNRNLAEMVRQGTFREDLFYRLYVIPISVPPLRERRSDIPMLLAHFVKRGCAKFGVTRYLSPDVIHMLCEYAWPGNVRELINLVERLLVTSIGELITEEDLPPRYRQAAVLPTGADDAAAKAATGADAAGPEPAAAGEGAGETDGPLATLADVVAECERQHINRALARYRTQAEAAAALGISLASLTRRIREYSLNPARRTATD